MKITDVIVDTRTFGTKFWLVDVVQVHAYSDGKRTETVTGFKYAVALPERGLEKVGIKIDGAKLLEPPENGYIEVAFTGLEIFIYWSNGDYQLGARAKGITVVNQKS